MDEFEYFVALFAAFKIEKDTSIIRKENFDAFVAKHVAAFHEHDNLADGVSFDGVGVGIVEGLEIHISVCDH